MPVRYPPREPHDSHAQRCTGCGCWLYRISRCQVCTALDSADA